MVDKKEKIKLLVNKIMEVVPFIGVYFALFIILFPSSVATLLFGQKWLGLIEVPMSLLAVAFVILPLASLLEVVLLGVGMVKERLKMVILINFANLALNGLLIWQYGIFGVVFTKIIVTMLSVVLFIHILKPVVFIKVPILFYSKILFVSLIIFISCKILGLYPRNILEYISMGLVYSIFFIIAGYYLKVFDYNLLKQLFNRTS
jgi:O-antigen/teichoic acid export membrane protein